MKYFALLLILTGSIAAFGQEAPLTREEYVKLLMSLSKAPASRTTIIDALRKRGVAFEVNDGIRSFTRSKAGNDDELRRALDEAGRRKQDPAAAKLPNAAEASKALEETRKNTLAAVDEMPDFVVKQQVQRSWAFAGTGNYKSLDKLVVAVSYRSTGEEDYRLLSKDGVIQTDPKAKSSYSEAGGTSSTGEFVTVLSTIFKPENETKFEAIDTDLVRGRRTIVYAFTTAVEKAQQRITSQDVTTQSTLTGISGKVWLDRESFRVLRIESEATDIPVGFPVTSARRTIDYDYATIAEEKYLLPSLSDVRLTSREQGKSIETRNVIRFKDYQKYGTEVIIRDDDVTEEPAEKKPY